MTDFDKVDAFLEHHGVLGMKWGRHTSSTGPSSPSRKQQRQAQDQEILKARGRQIVRSAKLQGLAADTYTQRSKKGQAAAEKAYSKAAKVYITHPDNTTAAKMTHGEKVVTGLQLGIGIGAIAGSIAIAAIHR